jgi:hypothetical protein
MSISKSGPQKLAPAVKPFLRKHSPKRYEQRMRRLAKASAKAGSYYQMTGCEFI